MFSSIYFGGYKSFAAANENSLIDLKLVNVIIGKNNSGKSSVLDVVSYTYDVSLYANAKSKISMLDIDVIIDEQNAAKGLSICSDKMLEQMIDEVTLCPPTLIL